MESRNSITRTGGVALLAGGLVLMAHDARAQATSPSAQPAPLPQLPPTPSPSGAPPSEPPSGTPAPAPQVIYVQVPATPTRVEQTETHWYGWQTLLVDGGWIVLAAVSSGSKTNAFGAVAGLTYFLGGPIVHWAHGHGAKGAIDLGLRFGGPLVGALLGFGIGAAAGGKSSESDFGGTSEGAIVGLGLGFLVGMVGAITVDAALLANEDVKTTGPNALRKPPRSFALVPMADVTPTKTTVGLGGRF